MSRFKQLIRPEIGTDALVHFYLIHLTRIFFSQVVFDLRNSSISSFVLIIRQLFFELVLESLANSLYT